MLHNEIENYSFKMTATFPRSQWVNKLSSHRRQGIYRPTHITERFSIFLSVVRRKSVSFDKQFFIDMLKDSILAIMLEFELENSELNKPGDSNKN